jgi:DUF4097 and DUF4098 domain-containing protein YvlB
MLAVAPLCQANDNYTKTATQSWDFAQGGKVELHMRFGDLRVVPTTDSQLSLSYTIHSNHTDFIGKVKTDLSVSGSHAVLRLDAPRNGNIDVELKVPVHSDLYMRVSAGDISVGQIEGNQNVETHAGDILIQVPEHQNYSWVEASTHAGDVSAPFGKPKGWVGNSLKYEGTGQYRVHAHTFAGDIGFEEPKTAKLEEPCKCEK